MRLATIIALAALADTTIELRTTLLAATWGGDVPIADDAAARAGWLALSVWLTKAAGGAHAREEEVHAASQELVDRRLGLEAQAQEALAHGRSTPPATDGGAWSHAQLSSDGVTPLVYASASGLAACVLAFLAAGASARECDGEPLLSAARYGRVDCARALLDHGATCNVRDRWGGEHATERLQHLLLTHLLLACP